MTAAAAAEAAAARLEAMQRDAATAREEARGAAATAAAAAERAAADLEVLRRDASEASVASMREAGGLRAETDAAKVHTCSASLQRPSQRTIVSPHG